MGPGRRRAGLALSGGGIRSAAVCLGVLQALEEKDIPGRFGWLSTVSGGGYTGIGWLARNVASGKQGFPYMRPERPADREAGTPASDLYHLRNNASFLLAPGVLPVLGAGAMWLRKLLVNMLILVPPLLGLAALFVLLRSPGVALAQGGLIALATGVAIALTFLALVALAREGLWRNGGIIDAPTARGRIDRNATWVFIAVLAVVAATIVATLPDWSLGRWLDPLLETLVPKDIAGMIGSLAALVGGGTVVSRMKGRFAGVALIVIAAAAMVLLIAIAMRIGMATLGVQAGELPSLSRSIKALALLLASAGLWFAILCYTVDANALSMHGFYRDRLADTFMGSTGPSPKLSELLPEKTGGPLPIVNATVAGASGSDMARRGRPAGPFTMTPLQAGSSALGRSTTAALEATDPDFDAMAAVALSAAAISPHAGRVTGGSAAVFLKSLLNARTGRWLPNPGLVGKQDRTFRAGILDTWREMIPGLPRSRGAPMVLVSDGGHWENLGVLSLAHRICPFIVAVDAEADPALDFNGLGVATMLARLDAGTEISIDTAKLRRNGHGFSDSHWVEGRLLYPANIVGRLLYIKATMTGDEPPDVLHYAATHPDFPHETTADQFFDEAQFEAYRALGEHIGRDVAPLIDQWMKQGDVT